MPIAPMELLKVGARVAYEDRANPRSTGRITAVDRANQRVSYTIQWDEGPRGGSTSTSDCRQQGWDLLADMPGNPFDGAVIIGAYTRAQAIEDGSLIDVSEAAREVGITWPVAITAGAWADCVAWPEPCEEYAIQDERGRLHDVVWMTTMAARRAPHGADSVTVELLRIPRRPGAERAELTRLKAVVGPGDQAEPVMTIMLPSED